MSEPLPPRPPKLKALPSDLDLLDRKSEHELVLHTARVATRALEVAERARDLVGSPSDLERRTGPTGLYREIHQLRNDQAASLLALGRVEFALGEPKQEKTQGGFIPATGLFAYVERLAKAQTRESSHATIVEGYANVELERQREGLARARALRAWIGAVIMAFIAGGGVAIALKSCGG
jgi:hypothetical protein